MTIEEGHRLYQQTIDYVAGYIYMAMDYKISGDLRDARVGVNTIVSPFAEEYLQMFGYNRYGNVQPIKITVIGLDRICHSLKCYEVADLIMQNTPQSMMHAPIEIAYYLLLIAEWCLVKGGDRIISPNTPRSKYYSDQAMHFIRIAVQDLSQDLFSGEDSRETLADLMELAKQEVIEPLFKFGTFRFPVTMANDIANAGMDGYIDAISQIPLPIPILQNITEGASYE